MTYIVTAKWTYVYAHPTTFSARVETLRRGVRVEGHEVTGATAHGSPIWVQRDGSGYVSRARLYAGPRATPATHATQTGTARG
jgi:hypothetical protein